MSTKTIAVEQSFAEWRRDADYAAAYHALEAEFSLASQIIDAWAQTGLGQAEPGG